MSQVSWTFVVKEQRSQGVPAPDWEASELHMDVLRNTWNVEKTSHW